MGLAEYKETLQKPLRQATLCFLINRQKEEILLAMKKRGFGKDLWNGVGGKVQPNESLLGAAARETQEEIKVKPISYRQVAVLDFYFPPNLDFNQQVTVFLILDWEGKPKESDEMAPKWFRFDKIPYESMWVDDQYWLPKVLMGSRINAEFLFGNNNELLEHSIRIVSSSKRVNRKTPIRINNKLYQFKNPQMINGFNLWLGAGMPLPFVYFSMKDERGNEEMIHATLIAGALEEESQVESL